MANITLTYKGLTGKQGSVTIDNGQTLLQLIPVIRADEDPTVGVLTNGDYDIAVERDTSITDGNNGSDTLLAAGIVDGDNIICIDEPTGTKEERQERKGRIASVKRHREGKSHYTFVKAYLPNPYEGNTVNEDDDENTGTLQMHRPYSMASGGVWLPSDESSLRAWWDATHSSSITLSGSTVTEWETRAGSLANAEFDSISGDPASGTRTVNSKNVVDFDGNDRVRTGGDGLSSNWSISDGNVVIVGFAVIDGSDNITDALWYTDQVVNNNNDIEFAAGNASQFNGQWRSSGLGFASATTDATGGPYSGNIIHATVFDGDDSEFKGRINGTERASRTDYTVNLDMSNTDFGIMSNSGQNRHIDGAVGDIMIFNTNDITVVQKAEGYLAHKWGATALLPSGHPYKSAAP